MAPRSVRLTSPDAEFPRLHLPTGRIGVEDIVEFLIREAAVAPVSDDWETTVTDARETFATILGRRRA